MSLNKDADAGRSLSPPPSSGQAAVAVAVAAAAPAPARPRTSGANVGLAGSAVDFPLFTAYAAGAKGLGGRPYQQDEIFILPTRAHLVLGVFDGHGTDGAKVSARVRQHVMRHLRESLASSSSSLLNDNDDDNSRCASLLDAVVSGAAADLASCAGAADCYLSGTTLLLVIVSAAGYMHTANVGDCAAYLLRRRGGVNVYATDVLKLTREHTCQDPVERSRVEMAGGRVERCLADSQIPGNGSAQAQIMVNRKTENNQVEQQEKTQHKEDDEAEAEAEAEEEEEDLGPLRIYQGTMPYPGLVVTRSLGDDVAHKVGVLSVPEITRIKLSPTDYAIVVGSDGLWDGCVPRQLPGLINEKGSSSSSSSSSNRSVAQAEKCARSLLAAALKGQRKRQIEDNVSAICVLLQHKK